MEATQPDMETIVTMVQNAMTITNNEEREKAQGQLDYYQNQFSVGQYAAKVIESLQRDELIANHILHLRVCVYLKEYLKK